VADSLDEAKAAFMGGVAAQALKWQTRSTSSDSDKVSKCPFRNFLNRLNLLDSKEVI
jgi:hypothetical protein